MKCEVNEGCKRKGRYTLTDHKSNKTATFCKAHFEGGMKAYLEPNPIIKHLMREGLI